MSDEPVVLWQGEISFEVDGASRPQVEYRRLVEPAGADKYPECYDGRGNTVPANRVAAHLANEVACLTAELAAHDQRARQATDLLREMVEHQEEQHSMGDEAPHCWECQWRVRALAALEVRRG